MKKIYLKQNAKVLFMGDSLTDCGRNYEDLHGETGYIRVIKSLIPDIEVFNRGINGECAKQILARTEGECEKIRPDVVSIFCGINDTTKRGDPPYISSEAEFYDTYRKLLKTAYKYTDQVIVAEPFLVPKDFGMDGLRDKLYERIFAIRRLANEFKAVYVPLDGIFAEHWVDEEPLEYTVDCVHVTEKGKQLIGHAWVERTTREKV